MTADDYSSSDLFDLTRCSRAYNSFGDRGAVNHLLDRNLKYGTTTCCLRKGIQALTAGVEGGRLPDFGVPLGGLEFASTEQARASFFGGSACDVSHAFKANPAL